MNLDEEYHKRPQKSRGPNKYLILSSSSSTNNPFPFKSFIDLDKCNYCLPPVCYQLFQLTSFLPIKPRLLCGVCGAVCGAAPQLAPAPAVLKENPLWQVMLFLLAALFADSQRPFPRPFTPFRIISEPPFPSQQRELEDSLGPLFLWTSYF